LKNLGHGARSAKIPACHAHFQAADQQSFDSRTRLLTNVTLRYARALAGKGFHAAVKSDPALRLGVNAHDGYITYYAVAHDLKLPYRELT
jgi:alanine dehydrogenase